MDLVDRRGGSDFLVVAGADFIVGDLVDNFLLDKLAMQGALLKEGGATLEVLVLVQTFGTAFGSTGAGASVACAAGACSWAASGATARADRLTARPRLASVTRR